MLARSCGQIIKEMKSIAVFAVNDLAFAAAGCEVIAAVELGCAAGEARAGCYRSGSYVKRI